jgi:hypothetical protein
MKLVLAMLVAMLLAACAGTKPELPTPKGQWSCLNCEKQGSTENSITDAPPLSGLRSSQR